MAEGLFQVRTRLRQIHHHAVIFFALGVFVGADVTKRRITDRGQRQHKLDVLRVGNREQFRDFVQRDQAGLRVASDR